MPAPYPACTLFFAVSDGPARAVVTHASGDSFDVAWRDGVRTLQTRMAGRRLTGRWLRVDWTTTAQAVSPAQLHALLRQTKRNYWREGLAFDTQMRTAITEQELNAHAALYAGSGTPHAALNVHNLQTCARARFADPAWTLPSTGPWHRFTTTGVFVDAEGLHALDSDGLAAGRRVLKELCEHDVRRLVSDASGYLAAQVDAQGRFAYGHYPCFDRPVAGYNTLRHASTTYAMIEAWALTQCPTLGAAIERALAHLEREWVKVVAHDADGPVAVLVDTGDEIKLGGNAVLILALTQYAQVTGRAEGLDLARALARGIRRMQDSASGRFTHVLHYPTLAVKAEHRIIYYDGEAAFALMRLYHATQEGTWLALVEKAFAHFIRAEHWRAHDHWLSYCVNELTRVRAQTPYLQFGVRNVAGYLDFVAERATTFPTLLELMMAARDMLERLGDEPAHAALYAQVDIDAFEHALERRAHRLLDGIFWPEFAMFMRHPDRILGACFIRHHGFRVRIDDVEHYLSGLIAYLAYVRRGRPRLPRPSAARALPAASATMGSPDGPWDADTLAATVGGRWLRPPPAGWRASGVCTTRPAMRAGDLAVLRTGDMRFGLQPATAAVLPASGWLVQEADMAFPAGMPVLWAPSMDRAVMALGRRARQSLMAPVIAVTGSAGKTTTAAMLAQALAPFGPVGLTRQNANLPRGVAWNLASLPADPAHVVLELAIGRMGENARLARPDVAIFTNIAAAHLTYHQDLATVANRKSAIFDGMRPGGTAIINRDMACADRVIEAARARELRILTYGAEGPADIRLRAYRPATHQVMADVAGRAVALRLGAPGRHLAMNALAVLATAHALGLALPAVIAALATFTPPAGRGDAFEIRVDARRVTVVDDSYNANPASMAAALATAREHPAAAKLLVLGDMLELGEDEIRFHRDLCDPVRAVQALRVVLCGERMQALAEALADLDVAWYPDVEAVQADWHTHLAQADYVLIKSSGATRLSALAASLRQTGANATALRSAS